MPPVALPARQTPPRGGRRTEGDGPTIGLILCAEKNEAIARYSVLHEHEQLFAAKYVTYLPSVEELERELARDSHMFEARSAELEFENRRIQEASRLKSAFLANMSHELRTPLNAIIGFSELLYDGMISPGSPQYRTFIGHILGSGKHLLQLINDVLDLSKIEAGKVVFAPELVDLGRLVSEVCASLGALASQKRVQLRIDHDESLVDVQLDPGRFKQILYNYLSNALKFSPDGAQAASYTPLTLPAHALGES